MIYKSMFFIAGIFILCAAPVHASEALTQFQLDVLDNIGGLENEYPGHPPFEKYSSKIQSVLESIGSGIQKEPNNPIWFYYKNQALFGLISVKLAELKYQGFGPKEYNQDLEVIHLRKEASLARDKLLSIDNSESPKIDASKYAGIVWLLKPEQKVIAYKRILKSPPYSENSDGRIRDYMGYAGSYVDLDRFEDAVQVLKSIADDPYIQETRKYTPSFAKEFSDEWIQTQIDEVWKMKAEYEAAMADAYAQVEPYTEVAKAELVAEPYSVAKEVPKPESKPVAVESSTVKENQQFVWAVIGGVIALLLLVWYAIRRRRK